MDPRQTWASKSVLPCINEDATAASFPVSLGYHASGGRAVTGRMPRTRTKALDPNAHEAGVHRLGA